jgi:hypothetical protein
MPADPESLPTSEPDRLDVATDQAIAACGGDARQGREGIACHERILGSADRRATSRRFEWLCTRKVRIRTA